MDREIQATAGESSATDLAPTNLSSANLVVAQTECPFCAEMISVKARKCRHCGETVDVAMRKVEEALRASERSTVYMNAGGGAAATGHTQQLRPFNHVLHIILSVITLGWWIPVYLLLYIFRNKSVYF